ncbi:hypothetical protein HDU67_005852, partial [Dinochytrium kinnereticum]
MATFAEDVFDHILASQRTNSDLYALMIDDTSLYNRPSVNLHMSRFTSSGRAAVFIKVFTYDAEKNPKPSGQSRRNLHAIMAMTLDEMFPGIQLEKKNLSAIPRAAEGNTWKESEDEKSAQV